MISRYVLILSTIVLCSCATSRNHIVAMSTSELKLRRQQLVEEIAQPYGWRFNGFHPGTEDHDGAMREKRRIEFELLRRWQSGERAAYLPAFGVAG